MTEGALGMLALARPSGDCSSCSCAEAACRAYCRRPAVAGFCADSVHDDVSCRDVGLWEGAGAMDHVSASRAYDKIHDFLEALLAVDTPA